MIGGAFGKLGPKHRHLSTSDIVVGLCLAAAVECEPPTGWIPPVGAAPDIAEFSALSRTRLARDL